MNKRSFVLFLLAVLVCSGCVDTGSGEKKQSSGIPAAQPHVSSASSSTTTTASSTTMQDTAKSTTTQSLATTSTTATSTTTSTTAFLPLTVEVVFFFPISPCENCIKVGELAEETINTYYSEELFSGTLVFKKANYFDPQNKELVKKYGPESSSLWIGTYKEGRFYKEMKIGVWYKTGNKQDYMDYLRAAIDKRLAGDLT